jgi:hypothetical protein
VSQFTLEPVCNIVIYTTTLVLPRLGVSSGKTITGKVKMWVQLRRNEDQELKILQIECLGVWK